MNLLLNGGYPYAVYYERTDGQWEETGPPAVTSTNTGTQWRDLIPPRRRGMALRLPSLRRA